MKRSYFVCAHCTYAAVREVISELKQCFIMPSSPHIYHSWTPASTFLTLHNLAYCIVLPTHVELSPYHRTFSQNVIVLLSVTDDVIYLHCCHMLIV